MTIQFDSAQTRIVVVTQERFESLKGNGSFHYESRRILAVTAHDQLLQVRVTEEQQELNPVVTHRLLHLQTEREARQTSR